MADLNNSVVVGNIVRDCERKEIGETTLVSFSIANNQYNRKKGEEEGHFIDCELWGKRAASLAQYLSKGTRVGVSGKILQDRWTDNNGNNRSKHKILALDIQLLGGKSGNNTGGESSNGGTSGAFVGGAGDMDDVPF